MLTWTYQTLVEHDKAGIQTDKIAGAYLSNDKVMIWSERDWEEGRSLEEYDKG